jgi:hypothetical protein
VRSANHCWDSFRCCQFQASDIPTAVQKQIPIETTPQLNFSNPFSSQRSFPIVITSTVLPMAPILATYFILHLTPSPPHVCLDDAFNVKGITLIEPTAHLPRYSPPSLPLQKQHRKLKGLKCILISWCCITAPFLRKTPNLRYQGQIKHYTNKKAQHLTT